MAERNMRLIREFASLKLFDDDSICSLFTVSLVSLGPSYKCTQNTGENFHPLPNFRTSGHPWQKGNIYQYGCESNDLSFLRVSRDYVLFHDPQEQMLGLVLLFPDH